MNRTFKIISRDRDTGLQQKKRVYTSHEDYLKYRESLIHRYTQFSYYDVEEYELVNGHWVLLKKHDKKPGKRGW